MFRRRLPRLLLALALPLASVGMAQPLAALAPDSSVVVLSFADDGGAPPALRDAWEALDWAAAGDALERLALVLGGDAAELAGGDLLGEAFGELGAACPAAADALERGDPMGWWSEGLLAVSLTAFAPTPHVVALARVADPAAVELQTALVGCFGGTRLEQDGVALEVLFDGSDLPLIVARLADLYVAGTDPDLVRGVIRRSLGAAEPSLATTALGAALTRLTPGGLGLGLDLASVAGVVEALAGAVPPEAAELLTRATAALRTLGVVAGRVGWSADGLLTEWWHDWPDDAPDAALAALLADPRTADPPPWMPAGSVAVGSQVVPVRGLVDYLDGWLAALEEPLGMRVDLRSLAADYLAIDLDAALLGWIGETVQSVTLEPVGSDLRGLVQGAATVVTIPVLDEELARDGLPLLGELAVRVMEALAAAPTAVDSFGGPSPDPFAEPFADPFGAGPDLGGTLFGADDVVVTRTEVLGVVVDRVRLGATLDLAVAVVDGHVLLVSPFRALPTVLAVRAGATGLRADPTWAALLAEWPAARGVSIADTATQLAALADLADLGAQPLAFAANTALTVGIFDTFEQDWDDDWGTWDGGEAWYLDADGLSYPSSSELPWNVDLAALQALPFFLGSEETGTLGEETPAALYELVGLESDRVVEVEMTDESGDLDTYLYVLDGDSGAVLFDNDDAPSWDRSYVAFVAQPGVRYQVLATSFGGYGAGTFRLAVAVRADLDAEPVDEPPPVAEEAEPVDAVVPPTFAELLAAADLLPQALDLLAARSGPTVSATVSEGSASFTRALWVLR